MQAIRQWLEPFTWARITAQIGMLCAAKNALHKPTSVSHDISMELWPSRHRDPMSRDEALDLCHRLAPFCLYNGNTFSWIIALVIRKLDLPASQQQIVRSLDGHLVAGVASDGETHAFREFCASRPPQHRLA